MKRTVQLFWRAESREEEARPFGRDAQGKTKQVEVSQLGTDAAVVKQSTS
jgi:hypothetical protein